MKLSKEFMDYIITKIPPSAWNEEVVESEKNFTIKNPIYAHIFWMELWQHFLIDLYKKQQMVINVENLDFTYPVYITENLILTSAQPILKSIAYYGTFDVEYNPPFLLKNTSKFRILIIYFILVLIIVCFSLFIKGIKKNVNINYI